MNLFPLLISIVFALSVDDRCKQMHTRYQQHCHATDVMGYAAHKPGTVFLYMYSNCRGNLKSISGATIDITETPATTNFLGQTVPKMRQCVIEANSNDGTAMAHYNQFGNSFELEVTNKGSVKTTITTSEGHVVCTRTSEDTTYTHCSLKIHGRTQAIPAQEDNWLGRVYMNQASLSSLSRPANSPEPLAPVAQ